MNTTFKRNIIAASVALSLGISSLAIAATDSGEVTPTTNPSVTNKASAVYTIAGMQQTRVESNEVVVRISPIARFTLIGTVADGNLTDDKNQNIPTNPGGISTFTNKLTNTGNQTDIYTLNVKNENDPTIETAEDDYDFTDISAMTVQIYKKGENGGEGTAVGIPLTVNNGETVTLTKDQYAIITYTAKTPKTKTGGDVIGGDTATLTLTATSTEIAKIKADKASLVNENQTIVKVPVFNIVKKASVANVNLNVPTPTYKYTIEVTNDDTKDYSEDAIGVLIQDQLPAGIQLDGPVSGITLSSTVADTSNGVASATPVTPSTTIERQTINVQGVALKRGETLTITIPVKVTDKNTVKAANADNVNNANVYDNYDDSPVDPANPSNADIFDSTNDDIDAPKVPEDDDNDTTTTPSFTERALVLEDENKAELPPTTGTGPDDDATYTHTITNNGNKPESGMKFTITGQDGKPITVSNVTYDPTPEDPNNNDTVIIPLKDGAYTIPGSIEAGGKGKISYDVDTTDAVPGTDYVTTVTLTPSGEGSTALIKKDTTSVKALKLVKNQALDRNCDGTIDVAFAAESALQNPASPYTIEGAKPGDCIVYRVTASNPFTSKAMSNVVITDSATGHWAASANYVTGSAKIGAPGATGTVSNTISNSTGTDSGDVVATFPTLDAAGETTPVAPTSMGTLLFTVKIKE